MLRRLTAKTGIREILNQDRAWALYALADLDDGMFEHSEWWASGGALGLVFHAIAIRPIFVMGEAAGIRELLQAMPVASGYLNLRLDTIGAAEGLFQYRQRSEMCRMMLESFAPRAGDTEALTMADLGAIEALFASGDGAGIAFSPAQLRTGFFRGIRDNGDLVAAAGIHVVSPGEGVAGVGNVFVKASHRGRGLAQTVLSSVVSAVQAVGIDTIGLNVEHTNAAAIAAYQRLGFRTRFRYYEGTAERV